MVDLIEDIIQSKKYAPNNTVKAKNRKQHAANETFETRRRKNNMFQAIQSR